MDKAHAHLKVVKQAYDSKTDAILAQGAGWLAWGGGLSALGGIDSVGNFWKRDKHIVTETQKYKDVPKHRFTAA